MNADDFGSSPDTVAATVECFEQGVLTSATIMTGMPGTDAAVAFARAHPGFSFGLHLALTGDGEERPVSDPASVPSLVTGAGTLLPTGEMRRRALLRRLVPAELDREISAQLDALRTAGVSVSHLDSHRHLHKFGAVRASLARVLPRFRIERVRRVQNVYFTRPVKSPTFWIGPAWQRGLARLDAATTTHFYMPTGLADREWDRLLVERMEGLDGSLEVGVHPGTADDWRDAERAGATRFVDGARRAGHELVPWTALAT